MLGFALPLSFLKSSASCLSVTISFMLTTLRCLSCRRIFISLMAVIGKPSFSLSKRTFFKATSSPVKKRKGPQLTRETCSALPGVQEYVLTCVFVLGLVDLAIGALPYDANDIKFIYTAFAPVTLCVFAFTISWAANPGIKKEKLG